MPMGMRNSAPQRMGMATTPNFSSSVSPSSWLRYSDSGPSTTQTMKLTSKYRNADSNVGQCPACLKSRQFMYCSPDCVASARACCQRHCNRCATSRFHLKSGNWKDLALRRANKMHQYREARPGADLKWCRQADDRRERNRASAFRNEGIVLDVKTQVPPGPVPCVVHAHPRPFDDAQGLVFSGRGEVKIFSGQVAAVEPPVNAHGAAQQAGALGTPGDIFHRLDRAQQHCGSMAFPLGHDGHPETHAVDHGHG